MSLAKRRILYRWMTGICVQIPAGLISIAIILLTSLASFYMIFVSLLAWGSIALIVAELCFEWGGFFVIILKFIPRRIMVFSGCIVLGIAIIVLGMWLQNLQYGLMDTTFELQDGLSPLLLGVVMGIVLGYAVKLGSQVMDDERHTNHWLQSQRLSHLIISPVLNAVLIGVPIGLLFLTGINLFVQDPIVISYEIVAAFSLLAFLASGTYDLLHYIAARLIFAPYFH